MNQARPAGGSESHWQDIYAKHEPDELSWYEPVPKSSLAQPGSGRRRYKARGAGLADAPSLTL